MLLTFADAGLVSSDGLAMLRGDVADETIVAAAEQAELPAARLVLLSGALRAATARVLRQRPGAHPGLRALLRLARAAAEPVRAAGQTAQRHNQGNEEDRCMSGVRGEHHR